MAGASAVASPRERVRAWWQELKSSFGFPAACAMLAGLVFGFLLPELDRALGFNLPVFDFASQDAGRSLLEIVATVTVSVAGLSFSVTVVAFTLASTQLSPRVLRTFRSDRMSRTVLACLLGTFIYCLVVLVRIGVTAPSAEVPNLSITVAVLLAFVSFALFTLFIAHIVRMLQPSTIIAGIVEDAKRDLEARGYPASIGRHADDVDAARAAAAARASSSLPVPVRSKHEGFLGTVRGEALLRIAGRHDLLVVQRLPVGEYVLPGDAFADLHGVVPDDVPGQIEACFQLGDQRTPSQDLAFTVRQLADIALKGLSPGINDPTTAETAMDALAAVILRRIHAEQPEAVRVDAEGHPRLVARTTSLDGLVRLGFAQVRVFAAPYPVIAARLIALLERIIAAADERGIEHEEPRRQIALLREGAEGAVPTDVDVEHVRQA